MHAPNCYSHLSASRWHTDNEKVAIAESPKRARRVVQPTGIWLYESNMMYGTPNGLLYEYDTHQQRIGIIYVICPYGLRDAHLARSKNSHKQHDYLDDEDCMSHSSDVYHKMQGNMCATYAEWGDFVI